MRGTSSRLHRAAHYTQRTRNGGEYGDQQFQDFFPVEFHSCNLQFYNLLFTIYLQFGYLTIGLPDGSESGATRKDSLDSYDSCSKKHSYTCLLFLTTNNTNITNKRRFSFSSSLSSSLQQSCSLRMVIFNFQFSILNSYHTPPSRG